MVPGQGEEWGGRGWLHAGTADGCHGHLEQFRIGLGLRRGFLPGEDGGDQDDGRGHDGANHEFFLVGVEPGQSFQVPFS